MWPWSIRRERIGRYGAPEMEREGTQHLAILVIPLDHVATVIEHVDDTVRVHGQRDGLEILARFRSRSAPRAEEGAVRVEMLDAVVPAIEDVERAIRREGDGAAGVT